MSLSGQSKGFGSGGLFSQSQPAQQTQPSQQSSNAFGQTLGGGAQGSAFGASAMQPPQQVQQMPVLAQSAAQLSSSLWQPGKETPHQKPILDQIKVVMEKWDPANQSCVFKHYFYNKVDEAHIPFYKPQPYEDAREWEEALQNKPAPGFMPVLCSGYAGVADRLKTQKRAVSEFNTRLHQVNGSLDAILQRHELETEVLRNRGYALSGDEDDLKNRLQGLEREVQDPALGAREEELWSRLIVLRGYSDRLNKEMDQPTSAEGEGLDPETEAKAKRVLEDYEKQLQHLKKELEALGADFEEWEKSHNANPKSR